MNTKSAFRFLKPLFYLFLIVTQLAMPAAALAESIVQDVRAARALRDAPQVQPLTHQELDVSFAQLIQTYATTPAADPSQEFRRGYYFALALGGNRALREGASALDVEIRTNKESGATLSPTILEAASVKLLQAYLDMPRNLAPAKRARMEDVFGMAVNALISEEQTRSDALPPAAADAPASEQAAVSEEQLLNDLENYFNNPDSMDESNLFFDVAQAANQDDEVWALDANDAAAGRQANWQVSGDSADLQAFDAVFSDMMAENAMAENEASDNRVEGPAMPVLSADGASVVEGPVLSAVEGSTVEGPAPSTTDRDRTAVPPATIHPNIPHAPLFSAVDFDAHTISTATLWARSVYTADIDGDGDMDVLSGSYSKVAWYENTAGAGSAGNWTEHVITTTGSNCVYAADIDADGDRDVLSASDGDDIVLYDNVDQSGPGTGDGSAWTEVIVAPDFDLTDLSVSAADVDGDGDMDILAAAHFGGRVTWLENGAGWATHEIATFPDDGYLPQKLHQ